MGAGKSTVGALLARRLHWHFADSDQVIEQQTGSAIGQIFEQLSEPTFRQIEANVIRELAQQENTVLAIGGGSLETPETRAALASMEDGCVIFLEAPLEVLITRCIEQPGAPVRPVLADREHLAKRWETRLPYYAKSHLTVQTLKHGPEDVVNLILGQISDRVKQGQPA